MSEVSKFMTRAVHSISYNDTVQNAAEKMKQLKIGSLLVIRAGEYVGIITDTDMTRKVAAEGIKVKSDRVDSIMTAPLISIDADASLEEANRMMRQNHVRHLVVREKGKIVGIISVRDIARYFDDFFRMAEPMFPEKRGYIRLPFSALATYEDHKKRRFESITYDISAGGVFIQTKSPLPRGTRIDIEFILPTERKTIRSRGVVTWLRKKSEEVAYFPITKAKAEVTYVREKVQRKVIHPGMGVKFTDIAEEDRIKIMNFIMEWVGKISPPLKE